MRLLRWGSDINTSLGPGPEDITPPGGGVTRLIHHSWSCTVVRCGGGFEVWGHDPLIPSLRELLNDLGGDGEVGDGEVRVIAREGGSVAGVLIDGVVYLPSYGNSRGRTEPTQVEEARRGDGHLPSTPTESQTQNPVSSKGQTGNAAAITSSSISTSARVTWTPAGEWDDIAVTNLTVLASRGEEVYRFPSLSALSTEAEAGELVTLPIRGRPYLFATETRAFIQTGGVVFELEFDYRAVHGPGGASEASTGSSERTPPGHVPFRLTAVDDLSGLNVRLYPGNANRVGAVSEAGEVYVLEPERRGGGVVGVHWPGEEDAEEDGDEDGDDGDAGTVVHAGDGFTLVLSNGVLWARGSNTFGQLGQGHTDRTRGWVTVDIGRVAAISACPFSAVALVYP